MPQLRAASDDLAKARDIVMSMRAGDPAWDRSAREAQSLARDAAGSLSGSFGDRFPSVAMGSDNLTALTEWPRATADEFRPVIAIWLTNVISDIGHEILLAGSPELSRMHADVSGWLRDRDLGHLELQASGSVDDPKLSVIHEGRCLVLVHALRDASWFVTTPDLSGRFADVRKALAGSDIHGAAMILDADDAPTQPGP